MCQKLQCLPIRLQTAPTATPSWVAKITKFLFTHHVMQQHRQTLITGTFLWQEIRSTISGVSAKNSEGYGYASIADTVITPEISTTPSRPQSFSIGDHYSANSVEVSYTYPAVLGGGEISKFKLEWDTKATFASKDLKQQYHSIIDEVQIITTSFNDLTGRSGTFTLSWRGLETTPLAWNESATNMALALQIITGAYIEGKNPVHVTRTDNLNGHQWRATFSA